MNITEEYELMRIVLKGVLKELGEISIALDSLEMRIINDKEKHLS